jgi:chromosome segregation protein
VNLRALEVYDKVKKEYDEILEKVNKLKQEKDEILKIIDEVDRKKKQSFMETFNKLNEGLGNNFVKLSDKGQALLELENKQDPFSGGVDIIVKISKGKEVDASSLSGGEKVIVALSFIFAIQEFKPYCFYIFDEVDAALDKHNSERLSSLLRNYIKQSQYVIITHNDATIGQADTLYGATMHEGVSKVVSLKVE